MNVGEVFRDLCPPPTEPSEAFLRDPVCLCTLGTVEAKLYAFTETLSGRPFSHERLTRRDIRVTVHIVENDRRGVSELEICRIQRSEEVRKPSGSEGINMSFEDGIL